MKPLLILKAGETYKNIIPLYGDFEDWIRAKIQPPREDLIVEVFMKDTMIPDVHDFAGIIITGSHDDVTDHKPWIEKLAAWLRNTIKENLPVLGICFGHQVLAYATGGKVGNHPAGQELGSVNITLTKAGQHDLLFKDLPVSFPVHANHAQTILKLPKSAIHLAYNNFEQTHAFRTGEKAWGIQFHPEYTDSIMKAMIMAQKSHIEQSGRSPEQIIDQVSLLDYGARILHNFMSVCYS